MEKNRTILVVEDDSKTSALVTLYLEREGFQTLTADSGTGALEMARRNRPDLVILDLMLPEMDGWEVCRRLRKDGDIPVIMLTARGEEVDRVAGLTLGADDYVVKPFSPRELVARVQAVLRRSDPKPENESGVFEHNGLELNTEKRSVTKDGKPVSLTPHEYSLLVTLVRRPGRVYTRDELISRLYPDEPTTVIERVVDVHIGKLRQKIEDDPAKPEYILTVRGMGYRFADSG